MILTRMSKLPPICSIFLPCICAHWASAVKSYNVTTPDALVDSGYSPHLEIPEHFFSSRSFFYKHNSHASKLSRFVGMLFFRDPSQLFSFPLTGWVEPANFFCFLSTFTPRGETLKLLKLTPANSPSTCTNSLLFEARVRLLIRSQKLMYNSEQKFSVAQNNYFIFLKQQQYFHSCCFAAQY